MNFEKSVYFNSSRHDFVIFLIEMWDKVIKFRLKIIWSTLEPWTILKCYETHFHVRWFMFFFFKEKT